MDYVGLGKSNLMASRVGFGTMSLKDIESEEEFAQHLADELCMFDNVPESITRFFDFKAFARELFMSDYDMGDGGHVFRTC